MTISAQVGDGPTLDRRLPSVRGDERTRQVLSAEGMIAAAGVLVAIASLGSFARGWSWWLLAPASASLVIGLGRLRHRSAQRNARTAYLTTAALLTTTVLLSAVGFVVEWRLGIEPNWIRSVTEWAAIGSMIGIGLLGLAALRSATSAGLILMLAIPLGLAIDLVTTAALPAGFFVEEGGLRVGLIVTGIGLIHLGRHRASSSNEGRPSALSSAG